MMEFSEAMVSVNPYEVRQELTDTMNDKAYVFRNETDLIEGLKTIRELKKKLGNMLMIKLRNTIQTFQT